MRGLLVGVVAGVAAAAAAVFYGRRLRPGVLNWGATEDESGRAMPGDEILRDANLQTTRAITIETGPEDIWSWLVQMGPRPRAGAYTYDWIERMLGIDIENADRILPEFQQLEAGEHIGLNDRGQGIVVRQVEPERFLVLQWLPGQSTWTFGLYPEGERTRLVSRNRLRVRGLPSRVFMTGVMEPGSLVMERKMLLGIKERAERLAEERRRAVEAKVAGI